jgi:hypothetical protein
MERRTTSWAGKLYHDGMRQANNGGRKDLLGSKVIRSWNEGSI